LQQHEEPTTFSGGKPYVYKKSAIPVVIRQNRSGKPENDSLTILFYKKHSIFERLNELSYEKN